MKKAAQQLINDRYAYLESVGRQDKAGLEAALKSRGAETVIRACLWRDR